MADYQANDCLIITWLASSAINDQDLSLLKNLVDDVRTFDYADSFADFITSLTDQQKVIWIVSDSLIQSTIPLLHDIPQIHSIYIHSTNQDVYEELASQYQRIKGVFPDLPSIRDAIENSLLKAEREYVSISVFHQDSFDSLSSQNDFNRLGSSFMFSQILKSIILNMKFGQKEKQQLLDYLRARYADNKVTLGVIDEFEHAYNQHSPAWWYTRDTFLYRLLNHALRLQEIDVIWKFGFFIKDLHQQLEQLYVDTAPESRVKRVYRGQIIQNEEFEKLKRNKHGLIAFNTFLSTSSDPIVSSQYAMGALGASNGKAILFEFNLDIPNHGQYSSPFASLEHTSYFEWEKEILFSMHTIFRMQEIDEMGSGIWRVHLTMTNEDDEQLREQTGYLQKELDGGGLMPFFRLMKAMGEYGKACEIGRTMLVETPSDDHVHIADIHSKMGWCYLANNDLDVAREHFEIAANLFTLVKSPLVPLFCRTGLGRILHLQGKYDLALQQYESFIQLELMELGFDAIMTLEFGHDWIASVYSCVGLLLQDMRDYKKALEMDEKALKLYQRSGMPAIHPAIVSIYNNIGLCHMHTKNYELALPYLRKTVELYERALPENHPLVALAHYNIAKCLQLSIVFHNHHEYIFEMIDHSRRALDIARISPDLNPYIAHYQEFWDQMQGHIDYMENIS